MNISYLDFSLKPAVFWLPYQRHSFFVNCAKELFKASHPKYEKIRKLQRSATI